MSARCPAAFQLVVAGGRLTTVDCKFLIQRFHSADSFGEDDVRTRLRCNNSVQQYLHIHDSRERFDERYHAQLFSDGEPIEFPGTGIVILARSVPTALPSS